MAQVGRRGLITLGVMAFLSARLAEARTPKGRRFANLVELREYVMAGLRKQPGVEQVVPSATDPAKFEVISGGGAAAGDVTNLFNYMIGNPDENAEWLAGRFINSFAEGRETAVEDKDIVCVLRTQAYLRGMMPGVLQEPFGADLVTLYMVDRPNSMIPIEPAALQNRDLAAIRPIAIANVARWLPKVVSDDSLGDGVLYYVEGNPLLSPSLLLVEAFWQSVEGRFPGDVLVALPRKDQLFLFDDGKPETMASVRRLIGATFAENYNLLSPLLYARRKGKFMVVPD